MKFLRLGLVGLFLGAALPASAIPLILSNGDFAAGQTGWTLDNYGFLQVVGPGTLGVGTSGARLFNNGSLTPAAGEADLKLTPGSLTPLGLLPTRPGITTGSVLYTSVTWARGLTPEAISQLHGTVQGRARGDGKGAGGNPVVDGVILVEIEIGRLENPRGHDKLVVGRIILSVDGGWAHEPAVLVHRSPNASQVLGKLEFLGAQDVAGVVVAVKLEVAIVFPVLRVADLDPHLVQLVEGLGFGGGSHPVELGNPLTQSSHDVMNHLFSFLPRLGRAAQPGEWL